MSTESLNVKERQHIQRAYSQGLYYIYRGFYDACRMYAPNMTAEERSRLTGAVGEFVLAYIVGELSPLISDMASDGNTRIAAPIDLTQPMDLGGR